MRIRILLVLIFALAWNKADAKEKTEEETPKFITVDEKASYALIPKDGSVHGSVAFALEKNIRLDQLTITIASVTATTLPGENLCGKLSVKKEAREAPHDPLLSFELTHDVFVETYVAKIRISKGDKTQFVRLTLIRPRAQLWAPKTLTLDVCGSWGWPDSERFILQLKETSHRTALLRLKPTALQFQHESGSLAKNAITFSEIRTLLRGERIPATGKLNLDRLSIGKTTGVVLLDSPMLKAPVEVKVTITKRLAKWWLAVTAVIGLLAGYAVRNKVAKILGTASRLNGLAWVAAGTPRFLFSAAAVLLTGYLTNESSFLGRPTDFMKVFVWGFGIDMGVSTGQSVLSKLA